VVVICLTFFSGGNFRLAPTEHARQTFAAHSIPAAGESGRFFRPAHAVMKIAETALTTLFVFHAFILMIPSKGEKKKSNQIKILVRWNLEEINENVKLTQSFNVKRMKLKKVGMRRSSLRINDN
jgi:hypothetical protein